jgi:hypothetical protein
MTSWFIEDPTAVCFILALAALAFGVLWWVHRRRAYLVVLGILSGILAVVVLLYLLIDTDGKRIERQINEMALGVAERNTERVFANVSATFRVGTADKRQFRARVEPLISGGQVDQLKIWDYQARTVSREARSATVTFSVKATGTRSQMHEFYNVRAIFVLDPDGQWRLAGFELFAPQVDPLSGQSIPLPF